MNRILVYFLGMISGGVLAVIIGLLIWLITTLKRGFGG